MTSDRAAVITVSDRCARGESEDRSGPLLVQVLAEHGISDVVTRVVPDGVESVRDVLRWTLAQRARLILTTGGTGVTPRDLTPEGTRGLLDTEIPGIAEAIRARGAEGGIPTAVLSRGLAGIIRAPNGSRPAVVINLPGSTGGARDGAEIVLPLWPHLREQLDGADHPAPPEQ
ncbi:molybdenum cofactor biosynthesis protein B [Myceligenerans pegani]|uniref:MogA/MoaB family molybdenum cofactor biosynthesis protein n=1 Tax=Myceligenerans pegani TaxID=2776917 RepID=A0ABR9MWY4_9MICO|nr:MogA/MoaB family molybdenum cofactor biosynthesis protein [Myceligenerans sp. TRM 65318]MBE1875908.1 MogA/MoaB family molybdenum cofactor biosynthesis protein [Myceligenerans sp. TRM 65318]MBE3018179.1 MogA/MoaB family molybdenum cofactor biosynthesis protein [Myceligenerans sp. TRM 65318]